MKFNSLSALLVLVCLSANARVFDFSTAHYSAFLKGQYALSSIDQSGFAPASNNGETYDNSLTKIYGGEFGFIYASPYVNLRFGLEVLHPPTLNVNASNSGGTGLYSIGEDFTVIIPKVGLEFNLKKWQGSRLYLGGNYGNASVEMLNAYTFTSAGTTATGKSSYTEDAKGTAVNFDGCFGWESVISDQSTFALEVGYRSLKFQSLTHNRSADTLAQGNATSGMPVLNADGSKRSLNFSGYLANVVFRIWIK